MYFMFVFSITHKKKGHVTYHYRDLLDDITLAMISWPSGRLARARQSPSRLKNDAPTPPGSKLSHSGWSPRGSFSFAWR